MKKYFWSLLLFAGCTGGQDKAYIPEVVSAPPAKYTDSFIQAEQNKAISDIRFGITEKEFNSLADKLKRETRKPDPHLKGWYDYYLGNFEYEYINGEFHEKKLWQVSLDGKLLSYDEYDTYMPGAVSRLESVITPKFGNADLAYPIPSWTDMEKNFTYLVKRWEVGDKRIEIRINAFSTSYKPILIMCQPKVQQQIESLEREREAAELEKGKEIL